MKFSINLFHYLLLLITRCNCEVIINDVNEEDYYRLLDNIKLDNYKIHMKLHHDFDKFSGSVIVKFKTIYQTNEFKLNYHNLNGLDDINNFEFQELSDAGILTKTQQVAMIILDPIRQVFTLKTKSFIPADRIVKLVIKHFDGKLARDMHGFYRSTIGDDKRVIATTQFESTYARHAFPCLDEPSFKATFDFSITFPNVDGYSCLSNTKKINETIADGYKTYTFATTPIMPTYLTAFIISDFVNVTDYLRQKPFSIWTNVDAVSSADFSLKESMRIIDALEEFTNIKFLLNKMDEIPIPDFEAGAMENWGLVTFKVEYLLYNKSETSTEHKKNIVDVIAHEFAHQWFGNLVTCNWWSNLWLNEGFATYMAPYIIGKIIPEYQPDTLFILSDRQGAIITDADQYSSPLSNKEKDIYTPSKIQGKFETITYSKGGHIIRMLEKFVGINNFISALRKYLQENKYKNANPALLFSYFTAKAPIGTPEFPASVDEIMKNWIFENGFPVLNISRSGNDVVVTQQKFLLKKNQYTQKSLTEWYVPISYTTLQNGDYRTTYPKAWLIPGQSLTIHNVFDYYNSGIIFNIQSSGFYITNYDDDLLRSIGNALKSNHLIIDENNRAQIIYDVMTLARARMLNYRIAFDLVEFVQNDDSYVSWYNIFESYRYILKMLGENSQIGSRILNHIGNLMRHVVRLVQFGGVVEDLLKLKMQKLIVHWSCKLHISDFLLSGANLFYNYMRGYNYRVPTYLRRDVFEASVIYDNNNWYLLNEMLKNSKDRDERIDIIYGMAATNNKNQLLYLLDQSITPKQFSNEEIDYVYASVSNNPQGVDAILEFSVSRWLDMILMINMQNLLISIVDSIITPKHMAMLGTLLQNPYVVNEETAIYLWQKIGENEKWRVEVTLEIEAYFSSAPMNLLGLLG